MPPRSRKKAEDEELETNGVPPEQDPEPEQDVPPVAPEADPEPEPEEPAGEITLLNPGTTAVVYSEDGRMIGGGERLKLDAVDAVGQAALDRGYLRRVD